MKIAVARNSNMTMKQLTLAMGVILAGAALAPVTMANAQTSQDPYATTSQTQQQQKQQNLKQQFRKMDTNRDGQVSRSESDTYWKRQFKSADTNNDGKLSRHELMAAVNEMNGEMPFNSTRFDQTWRKMASSGSNDNYNNNGSISRQEFLSYHQKMFKQADANNNDRLSKTEVRNAMQAHDEGIASL